jgi:hypothetical protein
MPENRHLPVLRLIAATPALASLVSPNLEQGKPDLIPLLASPGH